MYPREKLTMSRFLPFRRKAMPAKWLLVMLAVISLSNLSVTGTSTECVEEVFEHREEKANIIFSGTVRNVYPRKDKSGTYKSEVEIKRLFKGDINEFPTSFNSTTQYHMVMVSGLGNPHICASDIRKYDTRIFMVNSDGNRHLKLNSSLVRITWTNLKHIDAIVKDGSDGRKNHAAVNHRKRIKGIHNHTNFRYTEVVHIDDIPFVRPIPKPPEPCEYHFCAFGATCHVNESTNTPYCHCEETCNHIFSPVCSNDAVTYASECQLRRTSCILERQIRVRYQGSCDIPDPCESKVCNFGAQCVRSLDGSVARCECPTRCDLYGDNIGSTPVCGNDGIDYLNMCELRKEACRSMKNIRVKYYGKCDPCRDILCTGSQVCQLDDKRNPVCRCSVLCTLDLSLVCGSDNRTYSNECVMRIEACRARKEIRVVHLGKCDQDTNPCSRITCLAGEECYVDREGQASCVCPQPCEPVLRPVCGDDGVTYDNECALGRNACLQTKTIKVKFQGRCGPDGACVDYKCDDGAVCVVHEDRPACECPRCSEEFDPVCGTDGIAYSNECKLRVENCERGLKIVVRHRGLCNGCQKKKCEFYSVCQSDGQKARCVCPLQCVKVESKVCGINGITYQNECELKVASCHKRQFIMISSLGECDVCAGVKCKFGANCENGRCVCPMVCTKEYHPVCASDYKTYDNTCEMKRVACAQNMELDVMSLGECDEDIFSSSGDGSGHGLDDCDETSCLFGGKCEMVADGSEACLCTFNCDAIRSPQCGSDGRTYGNKCQMDEESCRRQETIKEQPLDNCLDMPDIPCDGRPPLVNPTTNQEYNCDHHREICPPKTYCDKRSGFAKCCEEEEVSHNCQETAYGCCPDGITPSPGPFHSGCPSFCHCNTLGSFSVTCDPRTRQCICKPGVGGLRCDRCESGYWGLTLIAQGNIGCTPCACNSYGSRRDDCEQMTGRCMCKTGIMGMKCNVCPDNKLLSPAGCGADDLPVRCTQLKCRYGAVCEENDDYAKCVCVLACPHSERPQLVCGSDGQTYGSECQLRHFSCRLQKDISVIHVGPCEAVVAGTRPSTHHPATAKSRQPNNFEARLTNQVTKLVLTKPTVRPIKSRGVIKGLCPEDGDCGIENGRCRHGVCECLPGYIATMENTLCSEVRTAKPVEPTPPEEKTDACSMNPCENGGTCLLDNNLGYSCICSLGNGGSICSEDVHFNVPSFTGNSYLELPMIPRGNREMTIKMKFRTLNKDGILLYNGQNKDGTGDFVSLSVKNGYLEYKFNLGTGVVTLRSHEQIALNRYHIVIARRNLHDGLLAVDDTSILKASSTGSSQSLNLNENLYLGNLPDHADLVFEQIGVRVGLVGCIEYLEAGSKDSMHSYKLQYPINTDILNGRQMTECGDNPCSSLPCLNGATCLAIGSEDFTCLCPDEFLGALCDLAASPCEMSPCEGGGICKMTHEGKASCVCPKGRTGKYCEKVNVKKMFVPEFNGSAHLELPLKTYVATEFSLEIWFMAFKQNGMLLFASQYPVGQGDFISLNLANRHVEFRYDLGSGYAELRSPKSISLNKWHTVVIQRQGRDGDIILDGENVISGRSKGSLTSLNLNDRLFVGGYKSILDVPLYSGIEKAFRGAVQRIYINGHLIDNLVDESLFSSHVTEYDGPPCNVNICFNDGICVPTLDMASCRCPMEYVGKRCEMLALDSKLDFNGAVLFRGRTFLQFQNLITETKENQIQNKFEVTFKTDKENGLLLFMNSGSSVTGDYMSLGIIDSYPELSYNLGKQSERNLHIVTSSVRVSDGEWHTVVVERDKRECWLTVDKHPPVSDISTIGASQLNTDGVLWIGGKPDLPQGLPEQYYEGFDGCIKDMNVDNNELHLVQDRIASMGSLEFCKT